jgi:hypothetical protein
MSPRNPPKVFVITSVMSEAPMAKTYCMNSTARLKHNIKVSFDKNPGCLKLTFNSRPNGIKNKQFMIISP